MYDDFYEYERDDLFNDEFENHKENYFSKNIEQFSDDNKISTKFDELGYSSGKNENNKSLETINFIEVFNDNNKENDDEKQQVILPPSQKENIKENIASFSLDKTEQKKTISEIKQKNLFFIQKEEKNESKNSLEYISINNFNNNKLISFLYSLLERNNIKIEQLNKFNNIKDVMLKAKKSYEKDKKLTRKDRTDSFPESASNKLLQYEVLNYLKQNDISLYTVENKDENGKQPPKNIKYYLQMLNTPLKKIYYKKITQRNKDIDYGHNIKIIDEIMKGNDESKIQLLNLTVKDCINIFISNKEDLAKVKMKKIDEFKYFIENKDTNSIKVIDDIFSLSLYYYNFDLFLNKKVQRDKKGKNYETLLNKKTKKDKEDESIDLYSSIIL